MSTVRAPRAQKSEESSLPLRDWILLPLIAFATIASIVGAGEVTARILWPQYETDPCYVKQGPFGPHFRPNCRSRVKVAEGPWIENAYNDCGYRTSEPCGTKQPGNIRIAVLGASVSYGYLVPYSSTYYALSGQMLTAACHRHVEFQNLGVFGLTLNQIYPRTSEALSLKPDLLLLVIEPFDVAKFAQFDPHASPATLQSSDAEEDEKNIHDWLRFRVIVPLKSSRAVLILQHFMYQSPSRYANLFLLEGDNADYARTPFTPGWKKRFSNLDAMLQSMSEQAGAVSVPMAILVTPSPAQGALVNSPPPAGVDPSAFNKEVVRVASRYGIPVIDPLPGFAGRPDVMKMFYVANGHMNAEGQRAVAEAVVTPLVSANHPPFAGCSLK